MTGPLSEPTPQKRPAYESATRLAQPPPYDPAVKRPISIVAGALLVLLRVVAGAFVIALLLLDNGAWAKDLEVLSDGVDVTTEAASLGLVLYVWIAGIGLVIQLVLGVFILRGQNFARVLVMIFSTISITTAFLGWWFEGQEITIDGTLLTLALDILILLALSSRSASAYARRNERL